MNINAFLNDLFTHGVELWPDGDQLGCRGSKRVLTPDRLDTIQQHKAEILQILKESFTICPLSYGQRAILYEFQNAPESAAYNVSFAGQIRSEVDAPSLSRALQAVTARHAALRTTIVIQDGQPLQRIYRYRAVDFEQIDAAGWSWHDLKRQIVWTHEQPFRVEGGPLLRVRLFSRAADEHVVLLSAHHIAIDGWSLDLLLAEWGKLYSAMHAGSAPPALPAAASYADYVAWQARMLQIEGERLWTYWSDQLAGELPILNLPTDRPRPPVRGNRGASAAINLPQRLTHQLKALARANGGTLYMLLLAAFQALLHRYSGQEDILVGSPIAGRSQHQFAEAVGYFTSPVVMRANFTGDPTFTTLLAQVRHTVLGALEHQDFPFPLLVERLRPVRDPSLPPVYQASFTLQKPQLAQRFTTEQGAEYIDWGVLRLVPLTIGQFEGQFDLALELFDTPSALAGSLKYDTDLFDAATIERMASHFLILLEGIAADPDQLISRLPLLTPSERNQLLVEWNSTTVPYPKDACVHQLFEAQAARTPDAIAVIFEQQRMSYHELDGRANQLAHDLRALGVGPEVLVGLYVERSIEMVVGLLGILKAGGAYVPLDPSHPPVRLAMILADAGAPIILTQRHLASQLPEHAARVVYLNVIGDRITHTNVPAQPQAVAAENLAYVLYTSGSTGAPKGVQISHRSLVNFLLAMQRAPGITADDMLLAVTTLAFDIAALELYLPLVSGATLLLANQEASADADRLMELLQRHPVTIMQATPATWHMLLASGWQGSPNLTLLCGGEAWFWQLAEDLRGCGRALWNMYGPTETTIWSTCYMIAEQAAPRDASVPIGRSIANTQVYVVDRHHQPVPLGVPGELLIGGTGLARGYHNHPELTQEKFIANPFGPGRLYRTGDLARYLPDGNLEFLDRIDQQVKIRGFRIELGEIEAALSQHPDVEESCVLAREDWAGEKQLVAYVVLLQELGVIGQEATDDLPVLVKLRAFLRQRLPKYMIPSRFVMLKALPLTPNGKLDRRALPPLDTAPAGDALFVAPQTRTEAALAALWSQALGGTAVGRNDNFFALGGHSLLATQLIQQVRQAFHVQLPLRSLFAAPTVGGMAEQIETLRATADTSAPVEELPAVMPDPARRNEPFPLTDVQHAYWIGRTTAFELGNVATHIYAELEGRDLDLERLSLAWQRLVDRHDMLRAVVLPDGRQQVLEHVPAYWIAAEDLRDSDAAALDDQLEAIREELSHQVRPAEQWPLFEIRASRLPGRRTRLHISFDVLIADGLSLSILARELSALYHDPDRTLPALALSFRDYILAEQQLAGTELLRRAEAYWFDRLDSLPAAPELPLATDPAALGTPQFSRRRAELEPERWERLKQRASQAGLTPSAVLLTAFAEVLGTWSNNPRFTINLTLFNRLPLRAQVEAIVGDFTSLTLLEVDTSAREPFLARARQLQQQLWDDLDHRFVSAVRVLRELARRHGGQRASMPVVFTSLLALDTAQADELYELGEEIYSVSQTPQVWLDHQVFERDGALLCNWDAVDALFPAGLLDAMFQAYRALLHALADAPSTWSAPIAALIPLDQRARRAAVNATAAPLPAELLHHPFLRQAVAQPAAIAVRTSERCLSYHQLAGAASHLAAELRTLGAQPNTLVAVVMHKGWEQVVAVLATSLAGAAYVPLDPELPAQRRFELLAEAQVAIALTQPGLDTALDWPSGVHALVVDQQWLAHDPPRLLDAVQSPDDLAYVIYTSGSTGRPKGVMVSHRAALNTIADLNARFAISPSDCVLALSALSFDLSVYDIFGLLAVGGSLVLPDAADERDPAHWRALLKQHPITLWNSVPALLQLLLDTLPSTDRLPAPLRLTWLSGDWIPLGLPRQLRAHAPDCAVISLGGATEAAIWSILYPIGALAPAWRSIPYGTPLANQSFQVLNARLEPCPEWVVGELYIGGAGLAQGYWRDGARTAERFVPNPLASETDAAGARLYRTGDLGRYLPDGTIEFLGRADTQVKLRGYRIELGEIEAVMQQHARVQAAVVSVVQAAGAERQLVAYLVPASATATPGEAADLPVDTSGIILDPIARMEFKLAQPGIRRGDVSDIELQLPAAPFDPAMAEPYLRRQSYRQFLDGPLALEQLSHLLSCLRQLPLTDAPLAKYRYPSASSLYPVQVYLYVKPDRVAGVAGGCYYYHPAEHKLVRCGGDTPLAASAYGLSGALFEHAAFALYLVGNLDAIAPMYGVIGRDFCLLEAGYMGQLLMQEAPDHALGLCPIGYLDEQALRAWMGLGPNHILAHSFVGGGIAAAQTKQWLLPQPAHTPDLAQEIRSYLRERLPAYMIPATFMILDRLPLNANGKVDRRALPPPSIAGSAASATFISPQTPTETLLAEIWADVLKVERVSRDDDFFALGGDSLLGIQLISRLREVFHAPLPIRSLFEAPTLANLAQHIEAYQVATSATDGGIDGNAFQWEEGRI